MILSLLLSSALSLSAAAQGPREAQMLNLSCLEALVAIGEPRLAGVFSFVAEKDAPAAFADLLVHDPKALKTYLKKIDRDRKDAGGIASWDHDAIVFAVSIYGSPLAATLAKPKPAVIEHMAELAQAPAMTLQELAAKRRKS